jgi:uncharacterized protein
MPASPSKQRADNAIAAAPADGPDAWLNLGLLYCSRREGSLDLVEAHKWFNLAAQNGNDEARRYRAEVASELTRVEIGEAQRRAREWLSQH